MKKSLFIILMVCLAIVGLVSCKNEIEPAQEELIYVSFEKGSSRALTATLEDFDVDDFYWSYEAKKNDGSGLKSGETGWDETGAGAVPVHSGQGLKDSYDNPVKVPGFSKGYWDFKLFAYKDPERKKLAYCGEADVVLIDNTHHTVSVTVSPISGGNGYLKVGTITFNPASSISVPTDHVIFTDTVWMLEGEEWVLVDVQPVDGVYTLPAKQYKFTRTYSYEEINVASGSVLVTVYSNLTTTVSGSLSELTSYAQFEANQNPDIITRTAGVDDITIDDEDASYSLHDTAVGGTPIVEAVVPGDAARKLLTDVTDDPTATMSLALNVDTVDSTSTSVTYEIGMTKTVTIASQSTTSDVKNLGTYTEETVVKKYYAMATVQLSTGLTGVKVTHDGHPMVESEYTKDDADYGVFFYNATTGILTIQTNTFSPFQVTYNASEYVAISGGVLYKTLEGTDGAIAMATEGSTITLLCDVELTQQIVVSKILTIETNGNTLKGYSYIKGDFDVSSTQETPDYTKDFYCDNTGMDSDKGIIRIKRCEARIGERRYRFITEAFAAATTDGTVTTITVNGDAVIKGNAGITIGTTQKIVLDLYGYTVKNAVNEDKASQVLKNEGTLTIMDSTDTDKDGTGNGKLFNSFMEGVLPGEWWSDPKRNYASNVITNCGTLTVKSGTILQTAAGSICYAVDNNSTNRNTTLNVEGGIITDLYGTAMRMFCNSTVNGNTLHMTGGEISAPGYTAFWIQLPGSSATSMKKATLSINGGTVSGGTYAFYDYSYGDGWDNVSYEITGGTFIGFIYSYELEGFISGGLFSEDPSDFVDKSCAVRMNDSMYEVYRPTYTDDYGVVYAKSDITSEIWDVLYDGSGLTVSEYTIPEGVKYIDYAAFRYNTTLQSITFPSTVLEIGDRAFNECTNLVSVKLNEGLLRIGERAFRRCYEMTTLGNPDIGIPSTVVYIGNSAFQSCTKWNDKLVLPYGIPELSPEIPDSAGNPGWFDGCSSLYSVEFAEGTTFIGQKMFNACSGLTMVVIPSTVQVIDYRAFYDCPILENVIIASKNVEFRGSQHFMCNNGGSSIKDVMIIVPTDSKTLENISNETLRNSWSRQGKAVYVKAVLDPLASITD